VPNRQPSISWKKVLAFLPGLQSLIQYRRQDLPLDLRAGLTVAAVALPIGFANAQIAGFDAVVGLYAFILPMTIYALVGTSRHLILGPDAPTAALVAAAITPLAAGNRDLYATLSIVLAMVAGLMCIGASLLRLGALADFLSRPILVGFLNGIAIDIMLGQVGKVAGFEILSDDIVPQLKEIASKLHQAHGPTLLVSAAAILIMLLSRRVPGVPSALVTMLLTALAVALFHLQSYGIATIGAMSGGLPHLRFDLFRPDLAKQLVGAAAGIATVSYAGCILDARIFASKNRYDIDADKEFAALGLAQIASAASQGFCIGSLDSGAALVDANGGRTHAVGLVAVVAIVIVLLFCMPFLAFVPSAALAIVVFRAAIGMMDIGYLRSLFRISRSEFALAILAMLGVIAFGAVDAIVVVVVLALLRFLRLVSRPPVQILGTLAGTPGYHPLDLHPNAECIKGLVLFRFNAPIVFFNASYFKKSVLSAADKVAPDLRWFVMDAMPVSQLDVTGWQTVFEVIEELRRRKCRFVIAGRRTTVADYLRKAGISPSELHARIYPTIGTAVKEYCTKHFPKSDSNRKVILT
jgi:high affinity sulfate transporter 1